MAATMKVYFDFGGVDGSPGTEQDTTGLGPPNIRFKCADDADIDVLNPVVIPGAGTNYSFWKHIYLFCAIAPDTQVDNIRFHSDGGGFGTGISLKVGTDFPTKNNSSSAGYEVADVAAELVANHSGISASANVFGYMAVSPAPLAGSISEAGGIIDAQNETSDYFVFQLEVINTAAPGVLAAETFTFLYDEV